MDFMVTVKRFMKRYVKLYFRPSPAYGTDAYEIRYTLIS
jgi:hypothetical protein